MKNNIPDKSSIVNLGILSTYSAASPFPDADVSFNWITCEYPYLHQHDYFEILIIISGELNNYINGKSHILHTGEACLIRPSDKHKLLAPTGISDNGQHLNFLIKPDYLKKMLKNYNSDLYDRLTVSTDILNFNISASYLSKLTNSCLAIQSNKIDYEEKVLQCKILVNRILNIFLEDYFSIFSAYPPWFSKVLFTLNNPYLDLNVNKLAKTTAYSYSRLSRIFKNLMGMSIVDYVKKIKMDYAIELLKTTNKSVTEIASALNYSSISYFNHTFKTTFGVTPLQMRNSLKR